MNTRAILVLCLLLASGTDSRATLSVSSSLEWVVDHARAIGIYKAVPPGKMQGRDNAQNDLDLELSEALKGHAPKAIQPPSAWRTAFAGQNPPVAAGDLLLVFFEFTDDGLHPVNFMNLTHLQPGAIDARLDALTDAGAILAVVRGRLAHGPPGKHLKILDPSGSILDDNYLVLPSNVMRARHGAAALQVPDDLMAQAMTRSDLLQITKGLQAYFDEKQVMPSGGNAAIIAALIKEHMVEDFNGRRKAGKLCDIWGTPYRIDASNPKFPWAYSCGPNKTDEGGTPGSDDIVSW